MKKIVVLGAGESGLQAALLSKMCGYETFVSDFGTISDEAKARLQEEAIPYEEGHHTLSLMAGADIAVKSPGIPPTAPIVQSLKASGTEVIAEIDFAAREMPGANFIAITGSNGKTTTTSLLGHILRTDGWDAVETGNIGTALARYAIEWKKGERRDAYVLELSSFQLEDMPTFQPYIAILLNITADHLDRYNHSLDLYADAKRNIFNNIEADGLAIYFGNDPETAKVLSRRPIKEGIQQMKFYTHPHEATPQEPYFASLNGKEIHFSCPMGRWSIPTTEVSLKGSHNYQNIMAAGLAALFLGANWLHIKQALRTFKSVPHRMEPCGSIHGVHFINDSKATNIDATRYALGAMQDKDIVLILGGTDKGNDYHTIEEEVLRTTTGLIFLCTDHAKLDEQLGALGIPTIHVTDVVEAVKRGKDLAEETGAKTVLLSPCCASFDLFKNYEQRGDLFKEAVAAQPGFKEEQTEQ